MEGRRGSMKNVLLLVVMLTALCAWAQQSSQPKSSGQPAQPQSAAPKTDPQSNAAMQPQAELNTPAVDKNAASDKSAATDKDAGIEKEPAKPETATPPAAAPAAPKSCLAVKPIGSHAFRNVMLAGVAGALISRQQYQVVDVVNYPASIGTKFHGDDLQTITSSGSKVVILEKHYKKEDLQKACH